jgi:tetratricopeptide (TPR) repeat protein
MDHKKLGNAAFREADYAAAITHFTAAISALDPHATGAATLYSNRSASYMLTGEPRRAVEDARSAISAKPQWCKGHYRLASALEALGKKREALQSFQECLRLEPDNAEVTERCATLQQQLREEQSVRANGAANNGSTAVANGSAAAPSALGGPTGACTMNVGSLPNRVHWVQLSQLSVDAGPSRC